MKIMAASDIHGSAGWAERIVETYKSEGADKLLLLGDILYHGPRNDLPEDYAPKKVIEILNREKDNIIAVRGNCDAEVDQMVLEFPILAESMWLTSGDKRIYATHGHHIDPTNLPTFLGKGDILLRGHTHVAEDIMLGSVRSINPGSPAIPKDGSPPSYVIIEDGVAELKRF
ncbi:MAG: phosphodiesterase [Clostridiales bacterium]|nr:phosphodiesterase [Clostridiales bacterium]